ncbi:hypothetical protein HZ993_13425 [Rhodoferax sp. AJA081-3]|uniref:hypothetical protein n=1 Tax=Rhodoferax sp. AJA081-3 TaxID=2752316 RepID=UPI001ADF1FCB|nr:hypothetical protein [Rhodoferax sp. AJA081-3]QTN26339.1 hypothetical protein HZ993_13425 [Rhodoferax sp. AJA081-3]
MHSFLRTAQRVQNTVFMFCALALFSTAHAAPGVVMSERADNVQIELIPAVGGKHCASSGGIPFNPELGIQRISDALYLQPLNSEVDESAEYLKAARQGGGIYLYLPYFKPSGTCAAADFTVKARHILWNGKWHTDELTIPAAATADKAVFFTNESAPRIVGNVYFGPDFSAATMERLQSSFTKIIAFYQSAMAVDVEQNVGVVAVITRNSGGYFGFGGDALNIIRMSYDNPRPEHVAEFETVFPRTFAHELAHKLQSEFLFTIPQGRTISEGSADFIKTLVLLDSGVIQMAEAKGIVQKALAECSKFASAQTMQEKIAQRTLNYREPFDCGMVYYFASYSASGLSGPQFMTVLRKALMGDRNYSAQWESLCLMFEPGCRNERLLDLVAGEKRFAPQAEWLAIQLQARPLPSQMATLSK